MDTMTKDLGAVHFAREFVSSWKEGDPLDALNDRLLAANAFTRLAMFGAMLKTTFARPENDNYGRMRVIRTWRASLVNGQDPMALITSGFNEICPGFDGFNPQDFDDDSVTEITPPLTHCPT